MKLYYSWFLCLLCIRTVLSRKTRDTLNDDRSCVLYLGFDRYTSDRIHDDSPYDNKAMIANGASIGKTEGSCGQCVELLGGEVIIDGKGFKGIPKSAVTIAMMINLINTLGEHDIFQTVGDHSDTDDAQYQLQIDDGKIRWFHRNEHGETVFSAVTEKPEVEAKTWAELAVVYDGTTGTAEIYINGVLKKTEISDPMTLSQDWGAYAGIGKLKRDGELKGYIDEFYIFNRTLKQEEIQDLHWACKGAKSSQVIDLDFDEIVGNITIDESPQKNNGLFIGTVITGVNGTCGTAVKVAANSEISVKGPHFRNKPTDAVTISLWVKLDDNTGLHKLFYTLGGHSMHTHDQYLFGIDNAAVLWQHHNEYDQMIFRVKTEALVVKGEWTHIAVTYDSSKEIAVVYVNGEIKEGANGAGGLSEDWDAAAAFGRHQSANGSFDWFDEVDMFDRELSPLEIRQLFMKCSFILPYGLRSFIPLEGLLRDAGKFHSHRVKRDTEGQAQLLYMNFDRISGDRVYDDSGYGNHGILKGLSSLARDAGKCGHGLKFHGGNMLLNGRLMKNRPRTGISIAMWLFMDTIVGQQELFQTVNPQTAVNKHGQYYLEVSDGQLRWFHRNENGETIFSVETPKPIIEKEVWIHVGATYDSVKGRAELYANGKEVQSEEGSGLLSQDWDGRVSVGKFYDISDTGEWLEGRALRGIMDELYIYNRALSGIEISKLSQICDFRRIVLYYGFNRLQGNRIFDQSGLSNFGTLTSGSMIVNSSCGQGVNLTNNAYIVLNGEEFRQKPSNAISIAAWIRLNTNRGQHEIFNTIGSRSLHKHDQYHFAIEDGQIIWFHRDHLGKEIFNVQTLAVVRPRQWVHIIVTYDSQESKAKAYLNGDLVREKEGSGFLSQDWGHFAGIGRHFYQGTFFAGAMDEISMYNYALPYDEIQYVVHGECVT